jgi:hypothetical protein
VIGAPEPEIRAGLIRKALLLPEFARLYPGVPAGEWMAAKMLAEYVWAERLRRGEAPFELGERVLDPRHFEFWHGAVPPKPPGTSRRASDSPIAEG